MTECLKCLLLHERVSSGEKDESIIRKTNEQTPNFVLELIIVFFLSFQMVQAIQVLRFHLLELEKVRIYCFVTFYSHYLV